jgi:predicted RNA methylase
MAGLLNKPQMLHQISEISALIEALPTHTVRSEDQIRFQQFSTPADLAALCVILAQPLATDIVLEPSAGHGALVATLPDVSALHLNEIDPRRREKLALLFPEATMAGIDGAMLASHLDAAVQPSLILMNPPFSRSMGRGADEFAAVRHLRAAITRLKQGGRIVAIMPDWFTTSAKLAKIYDDTFASCTVRTSIRLDKCYHKQGTSVAVRLYVIDKIPGQIRQAVLARETVADVASAVPIIKRVTAEPDCEPRAVPPKAKPGALFKAMRATPITKPVKARATQAPKIEALAFSTLDKPRVLGEQSGVYIPYRPSRVDIVGAREHPTPLVESVAMGSIPAPIPDYVPALQDRVLQESLLSEAQIETVIYAGNAWQQYLPGLFVSAEEGVGLQLDEHGRAYRKGYFLGDGTGAGKGRQITTETVYLATGLLLPIWSSLPIDYLEVRRIVDEEGRSWLGRMVHELDVVKLLEKFDIASTVELSPDTIIKALGEGRTVPIKQPFEATIKCSRVAGEQRYEIVGAPVDQLPWLKSIGCFTEIISFRTRAFIPMKNAAAVFVSMLRPMAE